MLTLVCSSNPQINCSSLESRVFGRKREVALGRNSRVIGGERGGRLTTPTPKSSLLCLATNDHWSHHTPSTLRPLYVYLIFIHSTLLELCFYSPVAGIINSFSPLYGRKNFACPKTDVFACPAVIFLPKGYLGWRVFFFPRRYRAASKEKWG